MRPRNTGLRPQSKTSGTLVYAGHLVPGDVIRVQGLPRTVYEVTHCGGGTQAWTVVLKLSGRQDTAHNAGEAVTVVRLAPRHGCRPTHSSILRLARHAQSCLGRWDITDPRSWSFWKRYAEVRDGIATPTPAHRDAVATLNSLLDSGHYLSILSSAVEPLPECAR